MLVSNYHDSHCEKCLNSESGRRLCTVGGFVRRALRVVARLVDVEIETRIKSVLTKRTPGVFRRSFPVPSGNLEIHVGLRQ